MVKSLYTLRRRNKAKSIVSTRYNDFDIQHYLLHLQPINEKFLSVYKLQKGLG